MIFVSWKNSENAISDHLETADFQNFLKCSAFISAQLPFTTKSSPRKNNTLQSGRLEPLKIYRGSRGSPRGERNKRREGRASGHIGCNFHTWLGSEFESRIAICKNMSNQFVK